MKTRIVSGADGVAEAIAFLKQGEPVALPTETVYGLAARALDGASCARIFEAKGRPLTDPLITHLPSQSWLEKIGRPSALALALAEAFWPGPLTLIIPRRDSVPDLLTAGQSTVAVRMSAHPLFGAVVEGLEEPLAAPSANRFGRISPTRAEHVVEELGGRIPLVLDGGPCLHGLESTIAFPREGQIHILRSGPVLAEHLAKFAPVGDARPGSPVAPGTMKSHYAPQTRLVLVPPGRAEPRGSRCGLLAWSTPVEGFAQVRILTPEGSAREAANSLYKSLRELDAAGLDLIVAETPPSCGGLCDAILERLHKASTPPGTV